MIKKENKEVYTRRIDENHILLREKNKNGISMSRIEDEHGRIIMQSPTYDAVTRESEEEMLNRFEESKKNHGK